MATNFKVHYKLYSNVSPPNNYYLLCYSNCLQLTVLDLSAVIMRADIGPVLKEIGKQLKVLSLEDTSWSFEEDAKNVRNIKLERLFSIYNLRLENIFT